jgi:hypothetical protein
MRQYRLLTAKGISADQKEVEERAEDDELFNGDVDKGE